MRLDAAPRTRRSRPTSPRPLGLDVVAAAVGMLRVAHANIVRGIRVVSVERGHDPRGCTLVPFGGAGPMHGTPVARELQHVAGGRAADAGHPVRAGAAALRPAPRPDRDAHLPLCGRRGRTGRGNRAPADRRRPTACWRRTACRRTSAGSRCASRPATSARATSCRSPLRSRRRARGGASPRTSTPPTAAGFGHADPEAPIEIVGFGATAIGKVETPELPTLRAGRHARRRPRRRLGSRRVFFEGRDPGDRGGWAEAQVLAREASCSPATRSRARPSSRRCRRPRCSIRAIAPRVDASGVLLVECSP